MNVRDLGPIKCQWNKQVLCICSCLCMWHRYFDARNELRRYRALASNDDRQGLITRESDPYRQINARHVLICFSTGDVIRTHDEALVMHYLLGFGDQLFRYLSGSALSRQLHRTVNSVSRKWAINHVGDERARARATFRDSSSSSAGGSSSLFPAKSRTRTRWLCAT